MFAKIKEIEDRFEKVERELVRPEVINDQNTYREYIKEHSNLSPIVNTYRKYASIQDEIEENQTLLDDPDPEMRKLAREEIDSMRGELSELEKELKLLLLPFQISLLAAPADRIQAFSPYPTTKYAPDSS